MKPYLLTCVLFFPVYASAGTIITSNIQNADGDTVLVDASGNLMSSGIAAAGYFNTLYDVNSAVLSNDFNSLYSNFNILTSGVIGSTTAFFGEDIAGFFESPSVDYGAPTGDMLGKTLYIFFGNSNSLETSTQFALVQFPLTIDSDDPTPDSNNLNLFTGGSYTVVLGTTGGSATVDLTSIALGVVSNPTLQLIPEPSTALLGALGMLALLRRRR